MENEASSYLPKNIRTASPSSNLLAGPSQHVTGKTHFDASLAYLMATDKTGHEMKRADAMQDAAFREAFNEAQALLRACSVAFIEISNPLELYLFEAYCAMELDTAEWNTFVTH